MREEGFKDKQQTHRKNHNIVNSRVKITWFARYNRSKVKISKLNNNLEPTESPDSPLDRSTISYIEVRSDCAGPPHHCGRSKSELGFAAKELGSFNSFRFRKIEERGRCLGWDRVKIEISVRGRFELENHHLRRCWSSEDDLWVVGHGWVWGLERDCWRRTSVSGQPLIFFFFEQISNHCGERETTRQIYICGGWFEFDFSGSMFFMFKIWVNWERGQYHFIDLISLVFLVVFW